MPTSPTSQFTDFTRDVLGRYICNGLDEALRSTDKTLVDPMAPLNRMLARSISSSSVAVPLVQPLRNTCSPKIRPTVIAFWSSRPGRWC
jgi:hypothetical protein